MNDSRYVIPPSTVKRVRHHLGWIQPQLAEALGMGIATVKRLEARGGPLYIGRALREILLEAGEPDAAAELRKEHRDVFRIPFVD